jgi:hypothetical protein
MYSENMDKKLNGYFRAEAEKVKPSGEWWQISIASAVAYKQKQVQGQSQNKSTAFEPVPQLHRSFSLNLSHPGFKNVLFKFAVLVAIGGLIFGLGAGIAAAVSHNNVQEQPPVTGTNELSITINGLMPGEEATLVIGLGTASLEVESALYEYPISGTGTSIKENLTPVLEDGYYLLLLNAPEHYFRQPKGYLFTVKESAIMNPENNAIVFDLVNPPTNPALEAVVSLSAPTKPPIPIFPIPLWRQLIEPAAITAASIIILIILYFIRQYLLKRHAG